MAVGYATLYGDMAGGFAVIKDISRRWYTAYAGIGTASSASFPERVLTRAPSAELKANQPTKTIFPL